MNEYKLSPGWWLILDEKGKIIISSPEERMYKLKIDENKAKCLKAILVDINTSNRVEEHKYSFDVGKLMSSLINIGAVICPSEDSSIHKQDNVNENIMVCVDCSELDTQPLIKVFSDFGFIPNWIDSGTLYSHSRDNNFDVPILTMASYLPIDGWRYLQQIFAETGNTWQRMYWDGVAWRIGPIWRKAGDSSFIDEISRLCSVIRHPEIFTKTWQFHEHARSYDVSSYSYVAGALSVALCELRKELTNNRNENKWQFSIKSDYSVTKNMLLPIPK